MATGVFILQEHYVIEVTIINYLLALGTSASPKEFFTPDPFSSLCSQAYVLSRASWPLSLDVGTLRAEPDVVVPSSFGQLTKQTPVPSAAVMALAPGFAAEGDTLL